ncbi:hypothetical protein TrLO_g11246 [Triparma laevis f. longispina]|uniref:Serine/threonine-protein kinase PLK n=1 Tax=Triparma laevis f. longispina TaxID=1714387 RepID=A0A9W7ABK6_9STRA|nr:hypothetical protein TrLO_g11246 [Triparma laevis f. longispina]
MTSVAAPRTALAPTASSSSSRSKDKHGNVEIVEITETRRDPSTGATSSHKYHKGRMLGKGGFAKVYHATSVDSNKTYAIKIVPKANLVKSRARQKLQAEIKIHRCLKHRRIVEYKHFFEDRTNCYILLELCHNQSMNELIKRRKRLTEPEVLFYMAQLIDGTRYMHTNNVIHRDLKLGNLFIDRHMSIKIGDLGLATKLTHSSERKRTICGTPNYIAPEIIDGKGGHSFQVDIWSMGVIMYTLLVGKPPYEAKDVKSTYKRIIANVYTFPDHVSVSERAKDLIRSMLQSKPEMRPTLDQVQNHEFFTANDVKIPLSLPQSSTVEQPRWRINSKGDIVQDTTAKVHADAKIESKSSSSRRPLQPTNTNANGGGTLGGATGKNAAATTKNNDKENEKPSIEPRTTRSRAKAAAAKEGETEAKDTKKTSKWAFKIYDDYVNGKESKKEEKKETKKVDADMDDLTAKTAAFTLSGTTSSATQSSSSTSRRSSAGSNIDNDMFALETMHQRLSQSFKSGTVPVSTPVAPEGGAKKWVTRYVDYTSKYGLGFLLNDGSAGVYFNDSTKVVLSSDGEVFDYVERKKTDSDRRGDHVRETHTLTDYPSTLQKKVILLKHFRNYLVEQHKRSEEKGEVIEVGGEVDAAEKEEVDAANTADTGDLVYLKKWVRTRHAILFRLSNRTVQVVFFDHTEVLLSCEARSVTYVDKERKRNTYSLSQVMGAGGRADIAKRLKYTKDILHQLITGAKR